MNFSIHAKRFMWLIGLLATGFVAGCGSGGDGSGGMGTASVSLTDAPACGYEQVNITVSKVRIHRSDTAGDHSPGWADIVLNPPKTINLLDLNDPTQPNFGLLTLGETPLEAGHYTQLRLVLEPNNGNQPSANWIVLEGQDPNNPDNRIPLDTPSAIQSGIKLIHQFTVNSDQRVDLLLDFDACHSIVQTGSGKYKLKPVIKVIPTALNGINGFVDKTLPNVAVTAQQNGQVVRATMLNTQTGEFFLARLDPGNYDVVITADNHATVVIGAVPVQPAPVVTHVNTSGTAFSLANSATQAVSGMVTLNPADDDGTVVVTANQSISGGPTVIVKSVVATVLDSTVTVGDYGYTVTLPTGAPAFAAFGPLPIIPSSALQGGVAKIYTIKGSGQVGATVYAIQNPAPSAKDITILANQTQDFTLTP